MYQVHTHAHTQDIYTYTHIYTSSYIIFSYLSSLVNIDETTPQVVRVTITDEGQVLEEHSNVGHSWGGNGTETISVALVVVP